MDLFKTKIIDIYKRVRSSWFISVFSSKSFTKVDTLDKKLIYNLSSRKVPSYKQLKYLKKFLDNKEILVIKIALLLIFVSFSYLAFYFITHHISHLPLSGGEYIEGTVSYPQTINPLYAINRDIDSDLSHLIYSSLFHYDQNGILKKDLVDSFSISSDNKEYLIKIKNGVKWHDGNFLTADDIVFTFNLIKNPKYNSPLRFLFNNVSIEKIDNLRFKFKLSKAYSPFLENLTFGILPQSLWKNIAPNQVILSPLNLKPIGSGPFKFKSLIKNSLGDLKNYYLSVNDDYYAKRPYIKTINFKFFSNYNEAVKALNNHQIMALRRLPLSYRSSVLAPTAWQEHKLVKAEIVSIFFNKEKNKALADKDIRIALTRALNKDEIIKDVFSGLYQRSDGPLLSESLYYNKDLIKYKYDPILAAKTLKNKSFQLTLTVVDSGSNVAVAKKIKKYWKVVGVKVSLRIIPSDQIIEIIKNRDFEAILYGEEVGGDPDLYPFWHSSQISSQGLNLASYKNKTVDKLLLEARQNTNFKERLVRYKKIQSIITKDAPAIFLYSPIYIYVQGKKLKGFSGTILINPADRLDSISDWYLKTKNKINWN